MGGLVRSVKKAVGGLLGLNDTPQIIMPEAPKQAAAAPTEVAATAVKDTEAGMTDEKAKRQGKGALKVTRSNVGGASGLNM